MSSMQQMMTAALAAEPGVVEQLDRLYWDTEGSPQVRLMCKGRGRTTRRHETGGVLRFKRAEGGWTLTVGRDSQAVPGVDTDGYIDVTVRCVQCGQTKRRAGRPALKLLLDALDAWNKRRAELTVQGITDAGPVRVAWH